MEDGRLMSWIKLDDQFPDHTKVMACGPAAGWLYVCGLCYCGRMLTDGFIPQGQVRKLADLDNPLELAARLVEHGLWERVKDGFLIHDYLEYNPSRQQVMAERGAAKERMKKNRNGSSPEVQPNITRTSQELPPQFSFPVPVPLPLPESHTQTIVGGGGESPRACPREAAAALPPPPLDDLLHSLGGKGFTAAEIERARSEVLSRVPPPIVTNWAHYLEPRLLENRQRDARPVTAPAIRDPNSLAVRTSKRRFDDQ